MLGISAAFAQGNSRQESEEHRPPNHPKLGIAVPQNAAKCDRADGLLAQSTVLTLTHAQHQRIYRR